MKIALLAAGRPDEIRPLLALALGLRHLGHRTVLAAPEHAADEIGKCPVEYYPLPGCGEPEPGMPGRGPIARPEECAQQLALLLVCRDCDAVLCPPSLLFEAGVLSEALRIPFLFVLPSPFMPATSAFPHFTVRAKPASSRLFNRLSHRLFQMRDERRKRSGVNAWRARLGLRPLAGSYYRRIEALKVPVLHTYSPSLVTPPADWGKQHYISGAVWLDGGLVPREAAVPLPDAFTRWLARGNAPVYIEAGCLPASDARRRIDMAVDLAARLRTRAVVAVEQGFIEQPEQPLADDVWLTRRADPRPVLGWCGFAVHSGDVCMAHAAAVTGTPAFVCSGTAEQAFWGERIDRLGIGRHLPARRMAPDHLAREIRDMMEDETMRIWAAAQGGAIRAERGLLHALEWVEKQLPDAPVFTNEPL